MIHRSMYPDDVDGSVCYVAPLNFEREDSRIYHFLDTVGTQDQRGQVRDFQIRCFENKEIIVHLLDSIANKKGWNWDFGVQTAFEYYILEYSFAFWQWGQYDFDQIPGDDATPNNLLNHLLAVSGVSFFENRGVRDLEPFFHAAMTEMGMYGYEYEPFKEYLNQEGDYLFEFTMPVPNASFSNEEMLKVQEFIQNDATEMIFIYGAKDTWSATAVHLQEAAVDRGLEKYLLTGGHHGTRIRSFPKKTQREIKKTIESWMD